MDAALRLRKHHQALVGESLGLSTFRPRSWGDEMRLMGHEVEIAKAKLDSVNQHALQDMDPASPTFGERRFMWGRDAWGSRPL